MKEVEEVEERKKGKKSERMKKKKQQQKEQVALDDKRMRAEGRNKERGVKGDGHSTMIHPPT